MTTTKMGRLECTRGTNYTRTAMPDADVTIRECVSVEDFKQCMVLERSVWQDDDLGIMPIRLYMISKHCNAPTIGAFEPSGELVGFVHTSLALAGRHVIYHSHLAGVVERLRHRNIALQMKKAQRERALQAGIPLIIWTFDPLQSPSAHLNINKLGAVIRRYEVNYYSEGFSKVFQANVPSDRVVAEWWISSAQVEAALAGNPPPAPDDRTVVEIPEDIDAIRAGSFGEHLEWRLRLREQFGRELCGGRIVRAFSRKPEEKRSQFIFGADDPQFHFDAYRVIRAGE